MPPANLTPNAAFKDSSLKATGEFGPFEHELPILLAEPCKKTLTLLQTPTIRVWLSVLWAHNPLQGYICLGNTDSEG